jgi:hypothetical protein
MTCHVSRLSDTFRSSSSGSSHDAPARSRRPRRGSDRPGESQCLRVMTRVRRSRLRTGAIRWGLYRDGRNPHAFVELYVVPM